MLVKSNVGHEWDIPTSTRVKELLAVSIPVPSASVQGKYTTPRTWGVYEIAPSRDRGATRRFRFGNHPIRQRELELEFSDAGIVALFHERAFAEELARLLNSGARLG